MSTRSEFHGNIGQVVVGTLHAAPRSKLLYSVGLSNSQNDEEDVVQASMTGGDGKRPRFSGGLKLIIGIPLMTLVLMGVIVVVTRPAAVGDFDIYCFTAGARHSVGSIVRMGDSAFRECVKLGESVPEWRPAAASRPF